MTNQPVPSITDEQIAEIEAVAEQANARGLRSGLITHQQTLLALISRLRAAEMDAESAYLRGLVDQKNNFLAGWESTGIWDMCESKTSNGLRAMDASIDAAMKGEQQ